MRFGFGSQEKTPELGALELQVLKCLWSAAAPVEARAVHSALAARRISLSTVYRTLNLFEEAGLVTKHDIKDGRARFELIPDEHHDHVHTHRQPVVPTHLGPAVPCDGRAQSRPLSPTRRS